MIYLDYCANTPALDEVLETFVKYERLYTGNANSAHPAGFAAKQALDDIIAETAEMLHVLPEEIILTSGATEANNLAVKGLCAAAKHVGKHILSTALEHSSVSASLTALQAAGYEIDLIPLDSEGRIDLAEMRDLIRSDTCLVSLSTVESETGVIQPVEEIAEILKEWPDCRLHIDATQAMGKIPVDFSCGDTLSFAPHKFFGLNGVGVLVKKKGISLVPQMSGGESTTIWRSGTPALALAASLVPALHDALDDLYEHMEKVNSLNAQLRAALARIPEVRINSPKHAVGNILNISVRGINGHEMQKLLAERDICVSVKSACSSDLTPSRSVMALTHERKRALEAFRISLSWRTAKEEIDALSEAIASIVEVRR